MTSPPVVGSPPASGTACTAKVLLRPWYDDMNRVERFLRKRQAHNGPSSLGCSASAEVQGHVPDLQQLALEDSPTGFNECFVPHVRADHTITPSTFNLDEDGLEPPYKSPRHDSRAELRLNLSPQPTGLGDKPRWRPSLAIATEQLETDIALFPLEH